MTDARLPLWERMECSCGNDQFLEPVYIKIHPNQGPAIEKAPRICTRCKRTVNTAQLQNILELKKTEHELKQKQEQLSVLTKEAEKREREESKGLDKKAG